MENLTENGTIQRLNPKTKYITVKPELSGQSKEMTKVTVVHR